jgi:hypothetical protein
MRGIDVFYQLRYFLSLNARNAYIQGRREYDRSVRDPPHLRPFIIRGRAAVVTGQRVLAHLAAAAAAGGGGG